MVATPAGPGPAPGDRLATALAWAPAPARALPGEIDTVAGTGTPGFSGDGGDALLAELSSPSDVGADAAGNLYFTDTLNRRVRRVDAATGVITTVAGDGTSGSGGDGGPATSAQFVTPFALVVLADGSFYVGDPGSGLVSFVDAATGLLTHVPTGGTTPDGLAVDAGGQLYIVGGDVVRRVDLLGSVDTLIGPTAGRENGCIGDGGLASAAELVLADAVAVDSAGNLYVDCFESSVGRSLLRRVDAATGIITTVAGGGAVLAASGNALDLDLTDIVDLAVDANDDVLIWTNGATLNYVYRLDVAAGTLEAVAGDGTFGFSGDGGSALAAQLGYSTNSGIGLDDLGHLLIADQANHRVRFVETGDVVVDAGTAQSFLDSLVSVASLTVDAALGLLQLVVSNLLGADTDVTITNNPDLVTVDLSALASTGGSVTLDSNNGLQSLDLGALSDAGGSVTLNDNDGLTSLDLGALQTTGGDVTLNDNDGLPALNLGSLTSTGGDLSLTNNDALTTALLDALGYVSADLTVAGNPTLAALSLPALVDLLGDLTVSGNTTMTTLSAPLLDETGGNVTVSTNSSLTSIELGGLDAVAGSLEVADNGSLGAVSLGGLTSTGGDLTITDNGEIETLDLSATAVAGDTTLSLLENETVSAQTAQGTTSVEVIQGEATMSAVLPTGAFASPVVFTVAHQDPTGLAPEGGLDEGGAAAQLDPVAAYQFTFAVPTLDSDATLAFTVDLTIQTVGDREALLRAVDDGSATLAVKEDGAGTQYEAFPVCASGEDPALDGCALVERLDGLGIPLPDGDPTEPSALRFTGVVGHFSSYALVTVDSPYCDPNGDDQVDELDVDLVFSLRGTPANGDDDPADADGDGTITVLDSAVCADRCRYEGCATAPPPACGLGPELGVLLPALAWLRRRQRRV